MSASYNEIQLDALRELANIGAGTASTALSEMLGRSIDLAVPDARVLPMADAVDQLGSPEQEITGIMLGVEGELPATVLMLLTPENAEKICVMLGLEPHSDLAPSALGIHRIDPSGMGAVSAEATPRLIVGAPAASIPCASR